MRRVAIGLLVLAATACGAPEDKSDKPQAPVVPAAVTFDGADYTDEAGKVAHGKRLAQVLDCTGCHGANLQGTNVTKDDPAYGDMNAPNITLLLAKYSDEDFDRLLRHARPKDGREFWFMPVESYQFLSDPDLAAIIAFLRTFQPAGEQLPPIRRGPNMLEEVEAGLLGNAAAQSQRYRAEAPVEVGAQHERGRQLARIVCTACHNSKLQGYKDFTPDLDIAGAYSAEELELLLTTGKGKSKPDLGLMSGISRAALSKLTAAERSAIIGYVKARAERPQ